jgi:hypothetical protein
MFFIISFLLSFLVFNILLSSASIYYVTSYEQVTRNDTLRRMCEEVMGFSTGTISAHTWRKPQSVWLTSKNIAVILALSCDIWWVYWLIRCNYWLLNDISALPDDATRAHVLNLLILLLPVEYRSTLRAAFRFLRRVVQNQKYNKMSLHNVAMIIAPSIFCPQ